VRILGSFNKSCWGNHCDIKRFFGFSFGNSPLHLHKNFIVGNALIEFMKTSWIDFGNCEATTRVPRLIYIKPSSFFPSALVEFRNCSISYKHNHFLINTFIYEIIDF
jgi:hypothetical protein